jgi:hypothetical protein
LELRVEYGPEDIVASELFRGVDADERLAEKADVGRRTLLAIFGWSDDGPLTVDRSITR